MRNNGSSKASSLSQPEREEASNVEFIVENGEYITELTVKYAQRDKYKPKDFKKEYSILPGTINEILVKKGSEVKPNTPILVLNSMKMDNLILSNIIGGVVKKVYVKLGQNISKSDLLIEYE